MFLVWKDYVKVMNETEIYSKGHIPNKYFGKERYLLPWSLLVDRKYQGVQYKVKALYCVEQP